MQQTQGIAASPLLVIPSVGAIVSGNDGTDARYLRMLADLVAFGLPRNAKTRSSQLGPERSHLARRANSSSMRSLFRRTIGANLPFPIVP